MSLLDCMLEVIGHSPRPRLLVIGDIMVDQYVWGCADRVSPEAPVLVLRVKNREARLGGAGSVAVLLRGLGADVELAGVLGNDAAGTVASTLLNAAGIVAAPVVLDPGRCTTVKERFLGSTSGRQPHQILRVDSESREDLSEGLEQQLLCSIDASLPTYDAILVSDYGKGVCTPTLLKALFVRTRQLAIPVIVDPVPAKSCRLYSGATIVKPNRLELAFATGDVVETVIDAERASRSLCHTFQFDAVIATLDQDGILVTTASGSRHLEAEAPQAICDITGAGDTVLAMIGICMALGKDLETAARLANVAAGLQVQRLGVAPIAGFEVIRELTRCVPSTMHSSNAELCPNSLTSVQHGQ